MQGVLCLLRLHRLDEQVRIDRLIGEAARDGDIVKLELNNHLLGLAGGDASVDFSPEFAMAIGSGPFRKGT